MPKRPLSPEEHEAIAYFAVLRWGDTGFHCDTCDHLYGYTLVCRPRVKQCTQCGHQQSVTAGTRLAYTRISLVHWRAHLETLDQQGDSVSAVQAEIGCARATAWLHIQKLSAIAIDANHQDEPVATVCTLVTVPVRRNRAPIAATLDDHRWFDAALRKVRRLAITGVIDTVGTHAQLLGLLTRDATIPGRRLETPHDFYPLRRWVTGRFRFRRVTLRWLPNWLGGTVARFRVWEDTEPGPWHAFALRAEPRPLRLLDPWANGRPFCAWSPTASPRT